MVNQAAGDDGSVPLLERVELSFWKGVERLEDAYDALEVDAETAARYEQEGLRYIEEMAVPLFRYGLGVGAQPDGDTTAVMEMDERGRRPGFKVAVSQLVRYGVFYDTVMDCFDTDRFDQVIGVFSSGVPFAYTVAADMQADPVIMRYSSHERYDDEVMVLPAMEDRIDDDGSYLIAEDHMESGETMAYIGQECLDRGADEVVAVFGDGNEIGVDHPAGYMIEIDVGEGMVSLGGHRRFPYGEPGSLGSLFQVDV